MNCEECKTARINKEGEAWRQHQTIKWLIIIIALLVCLLVGSNVAWLYYESQYSVPETVTQEITQDADNGTNNFIGGDSYGTADNKNNHNQNPNP